MEKVQTLKKMVQPFWRAIPEFHSVTVRSASTEIWTRNLIIRDNSVIHLIINYCNCDKYIVTLRTALRRKLSCSTF
jgi:hypothetical protein